jgi:hypothetical protein
MKIADIVRMKRRSMNPRQFMMELLRGLVGRRVLRRAVPPNKEHVLMSAKQYIVHVNPIFGTRREKVIGKRTPPSPPAVVAIPVAKARFWSNQWPKVAMLMFQSTEDEHPPRIPNARKN